jgi:lysyl-tRNA synthetase class 1
LTQLFPEDKILTMLQKSGFLPSQLNDLDAQYVSSRMKRAKYWVDNYAPEEKKIKLNETSTITASDAEKPLFKKIADSLRAKDVWNGEDLQTSIFQMIRDSGVPPKQVFSQLYQLFISRNEGPKIGPFISFMDRNYVLSMLEKAAM